MFDTEDYTFSLPPGLIAQVPVPIRDHSRLLAVDRTTRTFSEERFFNLPKLLKAGDLLVLNDTRVVPSRLFGHKESGGRVEILVLECPAGEEDGGSRWCLLRSSKRPKEGSLLHFPLGVSGRVLETGEEGLVKIAFGGNNTVDRLIEEEGRMPLPPYIKRAEDDARSTLDRERYQTVFSRNTGAVAAPTAGLHFTEGLVSRLKQEGVDIVSLTLSVGHGTFRPVRVRDIRKHQLGTERYRISRETAEAVNRQKAAGKRIIAVGTTVVRTLEAAAGPEGVIDPGEGRTDLLITPGFPFRVISGLITNFHLPKSSLLFLVSAFAGFELIKRAYAFAVAKEFRFFSYGDAMLVL